MTKVKQLTGKKRAGQGSTQAKKEVVSDGKATIYATRNGIGRYFKPLTWDLLPPDKDGWVETAPEKPADIQNSAPPVKSQSEIDYDAAVKNYTNVFGTPPSGDLTIEDINAEIVKKGEEDFEDHVVTQEDLDLNPELASTGVKVGETIKLPKTKGGNE